MKKIIFLALGLLAMLGLTACHQQEPANQIKVGTIAGPETTIMEVAKKVALKKYGLHIKIVAFSDYNVPNAALNDGSIDANMFQHMPFLKTQIKARGYKIVPIGKVFIYPMGVYSDTLKSLSAIKAGAKVAIPNDPSNEGRALLLLQKAGLIKLKPGAGFDATPLDIINNPKHLQFIELDAAELARAMNDVAIAVINTNFAIPAGLSPSKDALYAEDKHSPYANVVVVRIKDKNNKKALELVKALHSKAVLQTAKKIFGDGAIPAFK
ncbi:MAG: MetQ/NlpA family ABC transporter substrate-binding protein [Gammaproteobacteria bacterium]|nr:MetQ/NlpA family ABC transporter substrate-binding protein [Gammaproteobacteria bacterium]